MYGYAGSSATASQLTPFSQPAQTTNATGLAGQAAAVTQASGTSAGSAASTSSSSGLSSLLGDGITSSGSNTSTTGLAGLLNDLDGSNGSLLGSFLNNNTVDNLSNGFTTSGLLNPDRLPRYGELFQLPVPVAGGRWAVEFFGPAAGLGSGLRDWGRRPAGPGRGGVCGNRTGHAAWSVVGAGRPGARPRRDSAGLPPRCPAPRALTPAWRHPTGDAERRLGMPGVPLGGQARVTTSCTNRCTGSGPP